jgi:hypothetical protein
MGIDAGFWRRIKGSDSIDMVKKLASKKGKRLILIGGG